MNLIAVFVLALAVSLDGLGAGIAYGIRQTRIPVLAVFIISLASGGTVLVAMLVGTGLARMVPFTEQIGAGILVATGMWLLVQGRGALNQAPRPGTDAEEKNKQEVLPAKEDVFVIKLRPFGLIVQVLREPLRADVDCSGNLSFAEALVLGSALAMDALGAGLGAAMAGFPLLVTPFMVMVAKFFLFAGGLCLGAAWGARANNWTFTGMFPGFVLVGLGISWLLT